MLIPTPNDENINHQNIGFCSSDQSQKVAQNISPIFIGLESLIPISTDTNKFTFSSPYILCNEQRQEETLKELESKLNTPITTATTLHIGFSVWFNLDLLSIGYANYALILDIDPKVHIVYRIIKDSFQNTTTPEEFTKYFLQSIKTFFKNDDEDPSYTMLVDAFKEEPKKTTSFLNSLERFQRVKQLCDEGKIFFGQTDLTSTKNIDVITSWVQLNGLTISTLYISNIAEWVSYPTIKANIQNLRQPSTVLIDAFYPTREKKGFGPPLRILSEGVISDSYFIVDASLPKKDSTSRTPATFGSSFAIPPLLPQNQLFRRDKRKLPFARHELEQPTPKQQYRQLDSTSPSAEITLKPIRRKGPISLSSFFSKLPMAQSSILQSDTSNSSSERQDLLDPYSPLNI